jgi:hypothetical protein
MLAESRPPGELPGTGRERASPRREMTRRGDALSDGANRRATYGKVSFQLLM